MCPCLVQPKRNYFLTITLFASRGIFPEFEFAMKSLLAAAILSFASLAGVASAATVNAVQMKQNDWIVFDVAPEQGTFKVTPGSTDGSFSYSYGFSDTLCPQSWACMPQTRAFNTVMRMAAVTLAMAGTPSRSAACAVKRS